MAHEISPKEAAAIHKARAAAAADETRKAEQDEENQHLDAMELRAKTQ